MRLPIKLGVQISLLKRGAELDQLSLCVTALGILMLILQSALMITPWQLGLLFILLLVGLAQKMYALRVSLDADLFAQLAVLWQQQGVATAQDAESILRELDCELVALGLIKTLQQTRALQSRCQGALRLLKRQFLCVALQLLMLLVLLLSLVL
ncbi:hypothetical protein EAY24_22390 [Vibrio anguillarum]|uniref:hypothetical protein n=3 Tax=Vibrio anguillarum TaxID=55601 RepID=UPI00188B8B38|nr:hypothetical protein [Vibrio anguillarum]MBF4256830.1 hypothetical protein [Vibrio anguillarum]MBF4296017.1 hypothetical protein [Vibrio anguillarum]MBF4298802.1 hypothetical protein [Vibrio anguillarum]MBF4334925.1 hypothetical protein [Vibrio anguillarum]MBF4396664.1 hypothetical protein [Vibrio anguillarum]